MYSIKNTYLKIFQDLIDKSDSLVFKYFNNFNPIAWTTEEERYLKRKAFAELAIYLSVAKNRCPSNLFSEIENNTISICNSKDYHNLVLRNKKKFLLYASPILFAKYINKITIESEEVVSKVLQSKELWALERVPNRIMDLWNFCISYNGHSPINENSVMDVSCANYKIDIINSNLTDAYAFTHTPLFYFNFGIVHENFKNRDFIYDISFEIEGLILRYVSENNCDIVLELLLIGLLTKRIRTEVVDYVIKWVYKKYLSFGLIPGPGCEGSKKGISEDDWEKHYHTVFVAGTVFRYLLDTYHTIIEPQERIPQEYVQELEDYFDLVGEIYGHFSKHEIPVAVEKMRYLYNLGILNHQQYASHYEALISHLEQLKDANGNYGFWTDEEQVYLGRGGSSDNFLKEIGEPINRLCSNLLNGYRNNVDMIDAVKL